MHASATFAATLDRIAAATGIRRIRSEDETRAEAHGGLPRDHDLRLERAVERLERVADRLEATT